MEREEIAALALALIWIVISVVVIASVAILSTPYEVKAEVWLPDRYSIANYKLDNVHYLPVSGEYANPKAIEVPFNQYIDQYPERFTEINTTVLISSAGNVWYIWKFEGITFASKKEFLLQSSTTGWHKPTLVDIIINDPKIALVLYYDRDFGMAILTSVLGIFVGFIVGGGIAIVIEKH